MKKLVRVVIIVMLVAFAVTPLTAGAQGGTNPLCQGLSQADCDVLVGAQAAMAGVTAFSTPEWSISLMLSLPNAETGATETVNFAARGSGGGFDLTPGAAVLVHLKIDEATISDGTTSQSGSAEVILTPTMGYILFNGEWYGGAIEEGDLPVSDLAAITQVGDLGTALGSLGIDLTNVLSTTRTDEGGAAVFTTTVNLGTLITTALGSPMVGALAGEALGGGTEMSAQDLAMVGMFLTPLLANTSLSSYLAVSGGMISEVGLDLVLDIDLSMFAPEVGRIQGEVHFMSGVADYGTTLNPTIPSSYKPIEELENLDLNLGEIGAGLGL